MTTIALLRGVWPGALLVLLGAFNFFARYPSALLDRAPRADDPADRPARRTHVRRVTGGAIMIIGLALIAIHLFIPD